MKFVADRAVYCPSPVRQEPPSQKVSYPYCYCHNCQNPRGPLSLKYVVVISVWNIPQPSWTFLADFWGVTASCRSLLAGDVPEGRLGKPPMGMRRGATIWRITRKHATFWNFELLHVLFSRVNFFSVLLFLGFPTTKKCHCQWLFVKSQGLCIFVFYVSLDKPCEEINFLSHSSLKEALFSNHHDFLPLYISAFQ